MSSEEDDFYIVIPSNVQPNFHPNNTASSFRVTYEQSYDLSSGDWEVALIQMTYVNSMYNIIEETYDFWLNRPLGVSGVFKMGDKPGEFKMSESTANEVQLYYDWNINRYGLRKINPTKGVSYYMYKQAMIELGLAPPPEGTYFNYAVVALNSDQENLLGMYPPKPTILAEDLNIYRGPLETSTPKYTTTHIRRKLRKGYYKTIDKIMQELNGEETQPEQTIAEMMKGKPKSPKKNKKTNMDIYWNFDEKMDRVMVGLAPGSIVEMRNGLHEILGFKEKTLTGGVEGRVHMGSQAPLLNRGIYNFYIYCNLCLPIRVGDILAPLLQTVAVEGGKKWGTTQNISYNRPIYVPIQQTVFNSIQLEIRDDTGERIHFGTGKTSITLHFRRRGGERKL